MVPSTTPCSPSSNAWPARPCRAWPRHSVGPASLRAFHRVPSILSTCAHFTDHGLPKPSGAALMIEIGSHPRFSRALGDQEPPTRAATLFSSGFSVSLGWKRIVFVESAGEPHPKIAITISGTRSSPPVEGHRPATHRRVGRPQHGAAQQRYRHLYPSVQTVALSSVLVRMIEVRKERGVGREMSVKKR